MEKKLLIDGFRIHKVPGAHYESAATRKFIHGRTETIRSCSVESIAFAKAMLDKNRSLAEKEAALKQAIDSHKKYTVEVSLAFKGSILNYGVYKLFGTPTYRKV